MVTGQSKIKSQFNMRHGVILFWGSTKYINKIGGLKIQNKDIHPTSHCQFPCSCPSIIQVAYRIK